MKRSKFLLITVFAISGLLAVSCGTPDTASVRINLGNYSGQHGKSPSWVDRVVQVLTFSKSAYAQSAPTPSGVTNLRVEISAPDIAMYSVFADGSGGVIEINDVPAGSDRTFSVVADYNGDGFYSRYYGGMATVDLKGGENKDMTIVMNYLPLFSGTVTPSQSGPDALTADWSNAIFSSYDYMAVYMSDVTAGSGWIFEGNIASTSIQVSGLIFGHEYKFKLIPYNSYGHGEALITDNGAIGGW